MSLFNTCIITTSSESVAKMYRALIDKRVQHGLYPAEISFRVYSDNADNAPGSGGALLLALERYSKEMDRDFDDQKILVINAGGANALMPAFSPEGPLFTPLPLDSSSILSPVVLDLHLNLFLSYPWNKGELIVCPDNIIADFDMSAIREVRGDICGFSISSSFENGASHGVYKYDSFRTEVIDYFQKVDPMTLRLKASLEGTGECAVDIGIISLSSKFVKAFLQLARLQLRSGTFLETIRSGAASLDFYLEIITATLSGIDFDNYQKAVASRSKLDNTTLKKIFTVFSDFTLKAMLTRAATFSHLRTASDYIDACNELQRREMRLFYNSDVDEIRPFCSSELISFNSFQLNIPLGKHKTVIVESVQKCTIDNLLGDNIITGLTDWNYDGIIPEGICIEQRPCDTGTVKIVYSVYDQYKISIDTGKPTVCGKSFLQWLSDRNLTPDDIWGELDPRDLNHAHLYTVDCSDEFLAGYWTIPIGEQWSEKFKSAQRYSIKELDSLSSILDRDDKRQNIRMEILKKQILSGKGWVTASFNDFKLSFSKNPPLQTLQQIYQSTGDYLLKSYRKSHLEGISDKLLDLEKPGFFIDDRTDPQSLPVFSDTVLNERIIIADCPLRVDLAGGWTDLPPFTLQNGGAVVNFAVDLNEKPPVQVICRVTKDPVIRLFSIDQGAAETISNFEDLDINQGA
ncbi:MAG: hypothetical protein GX640_08645, partial [Fibrobacter sp.]|nr:hypothetical protein [Fibrobacter sp.]